MDASILAWFQIINLASTLPTEHKIQTAAYKEKMQCLVEKRCYSVLDTRDNTWIIRKKEPITIPFKESNSSDPQKQEEPISTDSPNQEIVDAKNIEE